MEKELIDDERKDLTYDELKFFLSQFKPCGIIWRIHFGKDKIRSVDGGVFIACWNTIESDFPVAIHMNKMVINAND